MKVWILASGSTANALVVQSGSSCLLVDCGLGPRVLAARLRTIGVEPEAITGVAITHEHSDHIHGLRASCTRWRWPVLTSGGTHGALAGMGVPGCTVEGARRVILPDGATIAHADFDVTGVRILHDAADPMALVITCRASGARLAIATDIGEITPPVLAAFEKVDALVLESNHCTTMLAGGPYPVYLKRRILARTGHLSNDGCAAALQRLAHRGLSHIVLAHLSEVNNAPEVALDTAGDALRRVGWRGKLAVAPRTGLATAFDVGTAGARATRQLELAIAAR